MVRFLSDDWVAAFNAALDGAELTGDGAGPSVRAESGTFSVEQRIRDMPGRAEADGPLRVVLSVADGKVAMATEAGDGDHADVVVSLSYEDAAALSRGELDPTQALGTGRVHVRGDLSVLVAGQALLAAAAGRLTNLQAETTY